ncbi:peptidase domain-containing ABC transporter [Pollutibacter soli]|uniref:peptidase domain-containing ABC transporter n=1 Tax=Pollutibacter soli TaxID=3034157 RepID=UPI003013B9EA
MVKRNENQIKSPVSRILQVLQLDKKEISAVYLYSILYGLIQLSLPIGIQSIISYVLGGAISTSLVILITMVVFGVFFNGLVQVNSMKIIEKVQQKIFVRYAFEYATRIPRLDLKSIDNYYLPELVNRFFDTTALQKGISKLLLDIPAASIQVIFGLILLSFYHPIFIVFSFLLITLVIIIIYFTGSRGMQTSLTESKYKYKVAGWLQELGRVVRTFKFSKGSVLNLKKTDGLVLKYIEARTHHFKILRLQYWTLIAFKVLITAAMLIVGSVLLIDQELNLGQFIASEIVILMVLNSVEKLIVNLDNVYDVLTAVEKLSKVIDQPVEKEQSLTINTEHSGVLISASNLGFSFEHKKILHNINFTIPRGSKVAVMGTDGSGKSTFMRVLGRIYNDYTGSLLVDNVPLSNYNADAYRQQTGMLISHLEIFNGTLLQNINMGDDRISPDMIIRLAEEAGLSDFISNQEDGFDTILDPAGKRLSRSVIQKILLLRALVGHPRLLLMDEPWRGLEESSINSIKKYLIDNCSTSTVIIETNDESFAKHCDIVLSFEDGTLISNEQRKQN